MKRAQPLYFGPPERPLFGWLHGIEAHSARLGAIVCNPFGYEAVCTHRTLRHMAQKLAGEGVPTLRFDYDGTGDSAGSDADPDRIEAWVASVRCAIDTLRARTGVSRVALIGLRLGATLAMLAAAGRDDVALLVATAPVVKGRAYLRELRAYQAAMGLAPPPAGSESTADLIEAAGFCVTRQTRDAIESIDLEALDAPAAGAFLVLDRDASLPSQRCVDHWRARGMRIDLRVAAGYAQMMLNAHLSIVPQDMIDEVARWIEREAAAFTSTALHAQAPAPSGPATTVVRVDGDCTVVESAVFAGDAAAMFGILAERSSDLGSTKARAATVLLNAGAIHRIGPNRLHVEWARRRAREGDIVLRVDISGLGDSAAFGDAQENVVYSDHAVDDVKSVIDWLLARRSVEFVRVVGLCSGAYHALKVAITGTSISEVVLINPLTFFWKPGMQIDDPTPDAIQSAIRYQRNVLRLEAWKKLLCGQSSIQTILRVAIHRAGSLAVKIVRDLARRLHLPLRDDLARELSTIALRGTRMRFVFSSSDPGRERLRLEGSAAVARLQRTGALTIDVIEGPNHTFTAQWAQAALTRTLWDIPARPADSCSNR